ncbi:hypothetical protein VC83_02116 [Pseudogymnoascus destructans]|uniref:Uncharacterized protein n=1 Tax=Pseudogymnoascus destructans TaxID=655981 RepID=A0A177AHE7_9PEZI|nr:uncharacterized protein VC83_02116 [Pseudogymnoascus destructans]OAF61488.1 hypothetical protein VC83_02116 [Pseudogymnoascus destructans]
MGGLWDWDELFTLLLQQLLRFDPLILFCCICLRWWRWEGGWEGGWGRFRAGTVDYWHETNDDTHASHSTRFSSHTRKQTPSLFTPRKFSTANNFLHNKPQKIIKHHFTFLVSRPFLDDGGFGREGILYFSG